MCGIVGIYHHDGAPADPRALTAMMGVQRHRGPDAQGARWFSLARGEGVDFDPANPPAERAGFEGALGFNRLSILDLSPRGNQPMSNRDGSVSIVFNGEIYNAFDYTSELESAGYQFRSRSDTEVILYLYEHLGLEGMLERLNGMFAIAIADLNRRELLLARDRLGIKPLYWYRDGGVFLFSSEVKSFLHHPAFRAELDTSRIDEYFTFRYCAQDGFLLKNVRQLEPGHWMRVGRDGPTTQRFWQVPEGSGASEPGFEVALDQLQEQLQRSVKLRMLSDVKVGCQLSGGIDSSLVDIVATRDVGGEMDAFSIVFDDPRFSEERWIDIASRAARVHSHRFPLSVDYLLDNLESATWYLDQPLNHPNSIGIYCLAENASRTVTVLLSGEGADELFGGYPRFYHAAVRPTLRPWLSALGALPGAGGSVRRVFGSRDDDPDRWFIQQSAYLDPGSLRQLRPDAAGEAAWERRLGMFRRNQGNFVERCIQYELETYLVDLLIRQDKMTMAHSMENRVPFLDHRMVEFARGLPSSHLVRAGLGRVDPRVLNTKVILKHLALRHFDREFVYRRKGGFDIPLAQCFSDPSFEPVMRERLLPGMRERGVVDADCVERWWHDLGRGQRGVLDSLWVCVAFEVWAQQFLDGRRPPPRPVRAPRG